MPISNGNPTISDPDNLPNYPLYTGEWDHYTVAELISEKHMANRKKFDYPTMRRIYLQHGEAQMRKEAAAARNTRK